MTVQQVRFLLISFFGVGFFGFYFFWIYFAFVSRTSKDAKDDDLEAEGGFSELLNF
jgi:hypothetical protein